MTPYGAPQAPLPIALNVNENTHPVPQDVADDILDAIALALRDVNRYPDREFTALREGFADYLGHGLTREQIWAANGSNEVLQHVLQAFGGPGRTAFGFAPDVLDVPAARAGRPARAGSPARAAATTRSTPEERGGAGRRRRPRRGLPLLAEQPHRHAARPRRDRGGLRRDARASSSSTRRTRSSRRARRGSALDAAAGARASRRSRAP